MPALALSVVLLAAPTTTLHEHAFHLEHGGEAVATIRASCERCDWGGAGS